jgi:hypothetical protein
MAMKQYVIDEFRPGDADKIKKHLEKVFGPAEMGSIFWLSLPEDILTATQTAHKNCRPFYFAVDVNDDQIACELLVRSRNTIRCSCIAYANRPQREWLISYIDSIFEALDIIT